MNGMEAPMKKMLAVLVLMLGIPATAFAESECASDADCPDGYGCVVAMCACAGCPEDVPDCPPCECGEEGMCVAMDTGDDGFDNVVLPSECEVDSDCPMDFKCQEMEVGCATPACPPCETYACEEGQECPVPECEPCDPMPAECTDSTIKACVYTPTECEQNSDCPADYRCEVYSTGGMQCTDCACACPAEGECPPCDCESSCEEIPGEEYGICVPEEKECALDSDCPDGWSCEIIAYDAGCGCTCAMPACDPDGGECPEAECPACECETPELPTTGYCYPGGWGDIAVAYDSSDEDSEGPMAPGGVIPVSKNGEELSAQTNTGGDGKAATGTDEGTSTGCTTSTNGTPVSGMLLAALALALMALRRKVR